MKTGNLSLKWLIMSALGLTLSTLVACNKDSGSSGTAAPAAAACGAGYVQHASYGCLPQSGCPANYGMYQNQCIVLTATNTSCTVGSVMVNNQCLPQGNCPAGYAFNGSTCVAANVATTPQPYPNYNPAYGAYNGGFYNNYAGWAAYYQPMQPMYYYQQPTYYYQQPTCYSCGGGGLNFYFGLRL